MRKELSDKIAEIVVARLKEARKERGLSHDKVANKARLHRSTISLIEAGKREPTLLSCIKIANALEVSLGEILIKAEKNKS
jgi:DNA-binding XRE family transcriptional regulator